LQDLQEVYNWLSGLPFPKGDECVRVHFVKLFEDV